MISPNEASHPTTFADATHAKLEILENRQDERLALTRPAPAKIANLNLVARVKALLGRAMPGSAGRWSNGNLARALSVNTSYISTYLAQVDGHGKPNPKAPALTMALQPFEDALESFLAQIADRKTLRDDLFETGISRQFAGFARQCIAARQWGVFHGPGGDGKTCAMQNFAQRNPLCLFVTAWQWCCGAGDIGRAIFDQVNKAGQWRNNTPKMPWLMDRLRGSERVILVDNFHQLTRGALTFLGNLHDCTGVPVICAGNPSGLERARQDEQLASRIKQSEAASFGDGKAAARAHHEAAERLLLRDAPDYSADLLPLAVKVVSQRGSLRALQARVALMNGYLQRSGGTDAAAAFRAAHAALISDGYSLD